jgi:UDP-N-acetylglucosamine 3-dehydrogenase
MTFSRNTVRIVVVGGGPMGLRHARTVASTPGTSLAGIVDTAEAVRKRAAAEFDVPTAGTLDELGTERLDGVIIALPDAIHREATVHALERDLAVLVEKPLATNVEDAQSIVAAGRDRLLMVGHLLRFDPRYVAARRRVQAGDLGELLHVYARRNSATGAARRYGGPTSLAHHVSVHDLDLLRWVTGREVVNVRAQGVSRVLAEKGHLDSLQALLRLDDGSSAVLESCWVLPKHLGSAIDSRFEVTGTAGMLEVTGFVQGLTVSDAIGTGYPDTTRYAEYDDGSAGGILAAEIAHFVRCIERGTAPSVAPEEGLAAVRLAAAIELSLTSGEDVPVTAGRDRLLTETPKRG